MSNQAEAMMQNQIEGAISENEALHHEIERLRGIVPEVLERMNDELCAENERLRSALQIAVRQNEHDMLMTGDELRACRAALEA